MNDRDLWQRTLETLDIAVLRAVREALDPRFQGQVRDPVRNKPADVAFDLVELMAAHEDAWETVFRQLLTRGAVPGVLLEQRWLEQETRKHSWVPIVGYYGEEDRFDVDDVVVTLYLSDDSAWRDEPAAFEGLRSGSMGAKQSSTLTIQGAFAELEATRRRGGSRVGLSIVGHPGAGKTTLLQQIFTATRRRGSGSLGLPEGLLPIYLRLATHWPAMVPREGAADHLEELIERSAAGKSGCDLPGAGRQLVPGRQLLVLLDGLDEVPDEATRELVCRWLRAEQDRWPGCRFVVTCRLHAWDRAEKALKSTLMPVTVQGFDRDGVHAYIDRWFPLVANVHARTHNEAAALAEAGRLAQELKDALDAADVSWRLMKMSRNPLLLSVLCLVHKRRGRLPRARHTLYEWCLGVLLEAWANNQERSQVVHAEPAMLALGPIAWHMHGLPPDHQEESTAVDEPTLLEALTRSLQAGRAREVGLDAKAFLTFLHANGVMHSPDIDRWRFVHLTFQEYLAARHAVEHNLEGNLAQHLGDPWWRETLLLAAAQSGFCGRLLPAALAGGLTEARRRTLQDCLEEAGTLNPSPLAALFERADAAWSQPPAPSPTWWEQALRWLGLLPPPPAPVVGPDVETVRQALLLARTRDLPELAEVIGRLARFEAVRDLIARPTEQAAEVVGGRKVVRVAGLELEFVWVPPGRFEMGSTEEEQAGVERPSYMNEERWDNVLANERPKHPAAVTRGFWLARFPTTNALYAAFVQATGYKEQGSLGKAGADAPAQPVSNVSWNDAARCCAWLTEQLGEGIVSLPTEVEWEWAARGEDGRTWPWGEAPLTEARAWFGGSRPGPVGEKPDGAGPFGAEEQAGTVWEWCASTWQPYPLSAADTSCHPLDIRGQEDDTPDASPRVVRGGSWGSDSGRLRCAARVGIHPWDRNVFVGFRLCLRPQHDA